MLDKGSIKLLTIRGVALRLHFSLIFLLAYVVLIASVQFPYVVNRTGVDPATLSLGPVSWGFLFALGLFISVFIHEFGHVLVAQFYGVRVRSITLMMLGGVSDMEKMPEKPYAEFKLAIVGPFVSLGLFALLYGVQVTANSPDIYFYSFWLGSANLILGIFNLLPAFPLDGGRALRSFLTERRGPIRATKTAVKVSKGFAWFLGIVGFLQFNFILLLIAFFIYYTAQGELFMLLSKGLLKGINVEQVAMNRDHVRPDMNLHDLANLMSKSRQAELPVLFDSNSAAVISINDLKRIKRSQWNTVQVRDVVSGPSKTVEATESLGKVLPDIIQSRNQALPVIKNGELIGIITYKEIASILEIKSLDEEDEQDGRGMENNRFLNTRNRTPRFGR